MNYFDIEDDAAHSQATIKLAGLFLANFTKHFREVWMEDAKTRSSEMSGANGCECVCDKTKSFFSDKKNNFWKCNKK